MKGKGGAYSWKGLNNDSTVQVNHIIVALKIGQNQKPKKNCSQKEIKIVNKKEINKTLPMKGSLSFCIQICGKKESVNFT